MSDHGKEGLAKRLRIAQLFAQAMRVATFLSIAILFVLLVAVFVQGAPYLDWQFLTSFPSRFPDQAGILAALAGTLWIMAITTAISVVIGIGAALFLEELAPKNRLSSIIEININNLAGVPSIVYGMLGFAVFVQFLQFGRSVIAGACTLSLLALPMIILASREALKAVPNSIRLAGFALGGTKWQVAWAHTLPAAMSGILTGIILAMARAIGETAPLLMIGAITFAAYVPEGVMDQFTALPIQIFNWASRPQEAFHALAAAAIVVLLVVLAIFNSVAIILRLRNREHST
jgi:phosphate transport system permease protein